MTVDIIEFLLARLAEDEAALEPFNGGRPVHGRTGEVLDFHEGGELWEISPSSEYVTMYVSPQRALAEVRAKRAIVDRHQARVKRQDDQGRPAHLHDPVLSMLVKDDRYLLRHLAAVYADHPGYRPEWRT